MYQFSKVSETNLRGVHPDLVKVARRAIELTKIDFRITEGVRPLERQRTLIRNGKSKTLRSRHLGGFAIDVVALPFPRTISWDWKHYEKIAIAMKKASKELNIPIEWGGDWITFKDGCHFQLPEKEYPECPLV